MGAELYYIESGLLSLLSHKTVAKKIFYFPDLHLCISQIGTLNTDIIHGSFCWKKLIYFEANHLLDNSCACTKIHHIVLRADRERLVLMITATLDSGEGDK